MVPFLIYDTFITQHRYPSDWSGYLFIMSVAFIYLCWTLVVAHLGGFWIYPVFGKLDLIPRVLFMILCSVYAGVLVWVGKKVNQLIWKGNKEKSV